MAHPIPTIVFNVDLTSLNIQGDLNPDMYTESTDAGRAAIVQKTSQHRILLTGLHPGTQYEVRHGGTITEHGSAAIYLLNQYGPGTAFPYLTVLSRSDVQA